jgi:hypothetical protein
MDLQRKVEELDARLRAAEDQLEILRLLSGYGPLVDSGAVTRAARLWTDGGGYDFTSAAGGRTRVEALRGLVEVLQSRPHTDLVATGAAHLTAMPHITLSGDTADAVGYSFVIVNQNDGWHLWRAAINHWALERTAGGWRIAERLNRVLDGSAESHATMRKVLG